MPKSALFISYDGLTDQLGESQIIPYLKGLSRAGYDMHVLSFEKPERAQRKTHIQQLLDAAKITWHPQTYTAKPPVISTWNDLRTMRKATKQVVVTCDIDLLHCRSYISALVGLELKHKVGTKFLFDMRGFWADERVEGGIWSLGNPVFKLVYNYFKNKERRFFTEADHIISLTTAGKAVIENMPLGKPSTPITVIPCCADLDHFSPTNATEAQVEAMRERLQLSSNALKLMYLGSIGTWYMLDEMLLFYKTLLESRPEAQFMFITREPSVLIIEAAKRLSVPTKGLRIQPAERDELPAIMQLADLGMFFIRPTFSKQASSPTKQGEMMAMRLPLICNSGVGDTDTIVQDSHAGIVIDELNEAGFKAAITQIDALLEQDTTCIREGSEKWYSLENGVRQYKSVYEALIGKPGAL